MQTVWPPRWYERAASKARQYTYRTTHYDIVPTLMHDYLGVTNPTTDYSIGQLLTDSQASRSWEVVGGDLEYAFIAPGDVILKKRAPECSPSPTAI